jgi:hypothetical protein
MTFAGSNLAPGESQVDDPHRFYVTRLGHG